MLQSFNYEVLFGREQRCRTVKYNTATNTLWMSFPDGLYKYSTNKPEPVFYNGDPIYVSSMEYANGKIYAGTFSGNLLVIDKDSIRKYTIKTNNINNAVLRMSLSQNRLWIFNAFGLSIFDIEKEKFVSTQSIPYLNGSDVWDVATDKDTCFLAATGRLYKVQIQKEVPVVFPLYLRYISINNQDTLYANGAKLSHWQNNLSFYITTPWYNRHNIVTIRYRLVNRDNNTNATHWYYLDTDDRVLQFNALAPGEYRLIIQAGINDNYQPASLPLVYNFTITRPWYSKWWFYGLLLAVIAAVLFGLYQYRIRQLLKMERLRRKISSDLHDEVGSTVSSINIYSQLVKNGQRPADYIEMIQNNTTQVINSLDDLVWNINPKFDTMEQLINKMKLFAIPILTDNHITCHFDTSVEKENKILSPEVRAHFYLILKEAINNVVKHAQCAHCNISVAQRGKELTMHIKDDGKGFDMHTASLHRNGLTSMQYRTTQLKGHLTIKSKPGEGTEIRISCNLGNTLKIT